MSRPRVRARRTCVAKIWYFEHMHCGPGRRTRYPSLIQSKTKNRTASAYWYFSSYQAKDLSDPRTYLDNFKQLSFLQTPEKFRLWLQRDSNPLSRQSADRAMASNTHFFHSSVLSREHMIPIN